MNHFWINIDDTSVCGILVLEVKTVKNRDTLDKAKNYLKILF